MASSPVPQTAPAEVSEATVAPSALPATEANPAVLPASASPALEPVLEEALGGPPPPPEGPPAPPTPASPTQPQVGETKPAKTSSRAEKEKAASLLDQIRGTRKGVGDASLDELLNVWRADNSKENIRAFYQNFVKDTANVILNWPLSKPRE